MTNKRFATHDIAVTFDDADAWPRCTVHVTCTRCPATGQADGTAGEPLYAALAALDAQPCALVQLNPHGHPVPAPLPD